MPHGFLRVDQYSVQRDLKVTRCAWVANWLALYLSRGGEVQRTHTAAARGLVTGASR